MTSLSLSPTPICIDKEPHPLFVVLNSTTGTMSTVFLSPVQSISKLDTFSGLPLPDDELGPTRSTPLLSESSSSPTRKNPEPISPLLDKVLRGAIGLRLDSASPEATSSLKNVSDRHDDVVKQGSTSSFTDILESRGSEMDQAWMEMQVSMYLFEENGWEKYD